MSDREIIELLRSGDFTVHYHQKETCTLYKGKMTLQELIDYEEAGPSDSIMMAEFVKSNREEYSPVKKCSR